MERSLHARCRRAFALLWREVCTYTALDWRFETQRLPHSRTGPPPD